MRSKREKEKIEMIYISKQGHLTQRIIRVIHIREDHIVAYCFNRREVRTFYIENILSAFPIYTNGKVGA
ncbi:hypothetical protein LD39_20730 [Halobacillus sp. BBL2006]|nr:hypothetical protein LD39_20730 [Halobacillus sp. BBL2006]